MMRHRYTSEQKEFIRQIAPGKYNDEIAKLFNIKFGTNLTDSQIKNFKAKHGIKSNVPRKRITGDEGLFTKKQKEFIEANVKGLLNSELAELLNNKFSLSVTARQISTYKKNHGLVSGLDCRFKKGQRAWNKGKKKTWVGGESTRFKKGHVPVNYKPVGSERINVEGYIEIKVADPNVWKLKHRVVWEEAYGSIPRGHVVLFADQNRQNVSLDNLILVPQSKLSTLNKMGLLKNDADLTRTGILIVDLLQKISKRRRSVKDG